MKLEYFVLRVEDTIATRRPNFNFGIETQSITRGRSDRLRSATRLNDAGATSLPTISIEKAELTRPQVEDERRDPRNKAIAPVMPVSLIEPVAATDGINARDPITRAKMERVAWGVQKIGALSSNYTGEGVTVAVLDTGIILNHPAFAGVTIERKNFTAGDDEDNNGHGTHCAGTIFGQDVDGVRIGVAPRAKAMIAKVVDAKRVHRMICLMRSYGRSVAAQTLFQCRWDWISRPWRNRCESIVSFHAKFPFHLRCKPMVTTLSLSHDSLK
jgi:hypothetical protein